MLVFSLCPFQVGIVEWSSPLPTLTVVVKATFDLGADGLAPLAAEQDGLSLDRASPFGGGELEAASDFAPRKAAADILLVGYAHTDAPSKMVPARLVVDDLRVSFVAISASQSLYIPLSERYLRLGPTADMPAVSVGPLPASSSARAKLGRGWGISAEGIPFSPLGERFDFAFYNVAPPGQQVQSLRANAKIRLHNLQEGVLRRDVVLPGIEPLVFLAGGGAARREIRMRLDTLAVDTERERATLVWRGHVAPFDASDKKARVVVASRKLGETLLFEDLADEIAKARGVRAVDAAQVRAAWDESAREAAPQKGPAFTREDDAVSTPLRPLPTLRAQTLPSSGVIASPPSQAAVSFGYGQLSAIAPSPFRLSAPSSAFVRPEPVAPHTADPPADIAAATARAPSSQARSGLGGMRLSTSREPQAMGFRLAAFDAWDADDASITAPLPKRHPEETTSVSAAPKQEDKPVDRPVQIATVIISEPRGKSR